MKSQRFLDRRAGYSLASLGLLLGMIVPAVFPAFASASQLSNRSIALSSSAAGATGVNYTIKFTTGSTGGGALIVDFCKDSPIPGQTCTAPVGFSTASVTTSTSSATVTSRSGDSGVKVVYTMAGSTAITINLGGITNPTNPTDGTAGNGFYARLVTYDTDAHAGAYTATAEGTGAVDDGGVAMAITTSIGVTAAVRETMTFCVAAVAITPDCANASGNLPSLTLGEGTPPATALDSSAVSTASVFTQISTNAASGAIVNMKSNATDCGGLLRAGAPSACDIGPATSDITAGQALFGVKLGTASSAASAPNPSGTIVPATGSSYNTSTYFMHFVNGNTSGVTGSYGDPLLDTAGAPVNNKNMELTFGASASNSTPAGIYSANLNLIATGTY